jgi:hypothetical protein
MVTEVEAGLLPPEASAGTARLPMAVSPASQAALAER